MIFFIIFKISYFNWSKQEKSKWKIDSDIRNMPANYEKLDSDLQMGNFLILAWYGKVANMLKKTKCA